jgi:hypothetical protein
MQRLKHAFYFFPIQLLLTSLKRYQILLVFWVLLFYIIVGKYAISYGVPYLFLDPEYLNNTGYLAFSLVGMGFGSFYVAWNLNCYMLHSYRFPFMALFQKPMGVYFLNNSIIPVSFLISYFYAIIQFQKQNQYATHLEIALMILGFFGGFIIVMLFTAMYFTFTNKDVKLVDEDRIKNAHKRKFFKPLVDTTEVVLSVKQRVDSYMSYHLRIHRIKDLQDYHPETKRTIYRQHHLNAFFIQLIVAGFIVSIGAFMDHSLFQIPTAASVFMFLSILMSIFGIVIYWTGGWGTTAIIIGFVLINEVYKIDLLGYQSRVYGIDYSTKAKYDVNSFRKLSSPAIIQKDIAQFYTILENWRIKNSKGLLPGQKPKLVFINVSGGGLRAASFTTAVLQEADSLIGGHLFDKTFMISGASGGMFGAAYMRELFLQKKEGMPIDLWDRQYFYNISRDLLNPLCVSMFSNDIFLPIHQFKVDSFTYYKDRGYMMEKQLSINTNHILDRRIKDYYHDELYARIPLLMIHTEVMNDTRRFFITPQPVSFFMRPVGRYTTNRNLEIDAIDFCRFFKAQQGDNIKLLSALRMNATFPLILPNAALPTEPKTYILDGGAIDNLGYEPTFRLMGTFRDWINENTSGVVIVQIRDGAKHEEEDYSVAKEDLLTMITNPLGTIFNNHMSNENFAIDQKLGYLNESLHGKVQMISFEYTAEKQDEKAALSLHLTEREKASILRALHRPNNVDAFKLLIEAVR